MRGVLLWIGLAVLGSAVFVGSLLFIVRGIDRAVVDAAPVVTEEQAAAADDIKAYVESPEFQKELEAERAANEAAGRRAEDAGKVAEICGQLLVDGKATDLPDLGLVIPDKAAALRFVLHRVIDADTVVVRCFNFDGGPDYFARVRLLYINAPEPRGNSASEMVARSFGRQLVEHWQESAVDMPVAICWPTGESAPALDRFGRLLAVAIRNFQEDNSRSLGFEAVQWGAAEYTERWSKPSGAYGVVLKGLAEARARCEPITREFGWPQRVITEGWKAGDMLSVAEFVHALPEILQDEQRRLGDEHTKQLRAQARGLKLAGIK